MGALCPWPRGRRSSGTATPTYPSDLGALPLVALLQLVELGLNLVQGRLRLLLRDLGLPDRRLGPLQLFAELVDLCKRQNISHGITRGLQACLKAGITAAYW